MLRIKKYVDMNKLINYGFYLEGNTYKFDVGKNKSISICNINRIVIKPNIGIFDFKTKELVDDVLFDLALFGYLEEVKNIEL